MTREEFKKMFYNESSDLKEIVILDGSSGTAMQTKGMPKGVCPEKWAIEHPDYLMELQTDYIKAGSKIIYTFTFGGNPLKLKEYGLEKDTIKINKKLAEISKKVSNGKAFVAGDIGPSGVFPEPTGDISFDEHVNMFKEQVKGLLEGGVDLFVVETMMDIQEARAAILAIREISDLPIIVSMTFEEGRRTLTGTDPVSAVITLQNLDIDAVGTNCSTGPKEMIEVIKEMKPYSKIPIIAKPNAGIPKLIDGKTVFDMDAESFANYTNDMINAGVDLLGGCCGTTPEYIEKIVKKIKNIKPHKNIEKNNSKTIMVSSLRKSVGISFNKETIIIGERINPTGKKKLQNELKNNEFSEIRKLAYEQIEKGAQILDVNVGMPDINEKEIMVEVVKLLSTIVDTPLCIDSSSPEVIEEALKIYPGRAIINSTSAEKEKMQKIFPIAKKYGAVVIALPITEKGIPKTASERLSVTNFILQEATNKYYFPVEDIIIDGITMTVSSDQNAAKETINFINELSKQQINTVIGLSNISFGLPERGWINASFLAMAIQSGVSCVIANPSIDLIIKTKYASDVLACRDKNSEKYIQKFSNTPKLMKIEKSEELFIDKKIYNAVVIGEKEKINEYINEALKNNFSPNEITDKILIPAITYVGDLYEEKKYFLPQLIQSAETMKKAFSILEPLLTKKEENKKETKIIIATVKGDIHDIGKNIVALMLRNYGFNVIDLGKDVSKEEIIEKAKKEKPDIICLSALMTTTMGEMENVIKYAKGNNINVKFMVGGAVVTKNYAEKIGAYYSKDAYEAVKVAKKISTSK